jgi:hypothetical protein
MPEGCKRLDASCDFQQSNQLPTPAYIGGCMADGSIKMAGLADTIRLADLIPVAAQTGKGREGDPFRVYRGHIPHCTGVSYLDSYTPSDGGAPRLVADINLEACGTSILGVWDTGTGAFLRALPSQTDDEKFTSLVTYQRASDGRPRIAAGLGKGHLCIWDGDDFSTLHAILANREGCSVYRLAVYEEPTGGRTRIVTG